MAARLLAAGLSMAASWPARADPGQDYRHLLETNLWVAERIQQQAVALCAIAEANGYTRNNRVTQAVEANTGVLASLLAKVHLSTVRQQDETQWQGVLQSQFADSIQHTNECRNNYVTHTQDAVFVPVASLKAVLVRAQPPTPTPAPAPAPRTSAAPSSPGSSALVLQVFPKDNLTEQGMVLLQSALPEFVVTKGVSAIDRAHPADVLFVNRRLVTPGEVTQAARALSKIGIPIRSIQQSDVFPTARKIQVGTIVDRETGRGIFVDTPPVDLDRLSSLQGTAFWRAGFNGTVYCSAGVGYSLGCVMDANGYPRPPA